MTTPCERQPPRSIHLLVAARPNFMKIAPLFHALARRPDRYRPVLVQARQHVSARMSDDLRGELGLPAPVHCIAAGGSSHAAQTAAIMLGYERVCLADPPDMAVVPGDVNATLGAALAATKLGIPVAHLEAGLRCGDRSMPEEINRRAVGAIADLHWAPSHDAAANLAAEGVAGARIACVGNVMIDCYETMRARIAADPGPAGLGLAPGRYAVATFHRPANVDRHEALSSVAQALRVAASRLDVVFPVHPRTRARLASSAIADDLAAEPRIRMLEPLGYVGFMALLRAARCVITDSGGVQEEATHLRVPCLTLRASTERPVTLAQGSNRLVRPEAIGAAIDAVLSGAHRVGDPPALWDGHAAERAVESLDRWFATASPVITSAADPRAS